MKGGYGNIMKYKKSSVLYIIAITVIFIGAINPMFTYFSVLIAIGIGVEQGLLSIKKLSCDHCKGIMLLLVLQNFALGLGAHITRNTDSSLSLITQIPFIVIASEWFILIICKKKTVRRKNIDYYFAYFYYLCLSLCCLVEVRFNQF